MSDSARDPAMHAVARLEAAVERLAQVLTTRPDTQALDPDLLDVVPRAEVAAIAERLEATIARLRAALPEEYRLGPEPSLGES